jgi:hypothetical protein
MIRRLTLLLAALAPAAFFTPSARAGQEIGTWEYHVFAAKASLDSGDMLAKERALGPDVDGDGSLSSGTFTRSSTLDDNLFAGFRLGYVWTKQFESEVSYDRNHTGGNYEHVVDDDFTGQVEKVDGRIGAVITSYQLGLLYHPLGSWQTRWQPYANISAGWIDVDIAPSATLQTELNKSVAGSHFKLDFPQGDHGLMLGYGAGCKYYILPNLAVRAEFRGKTYTLFSERRRDAEISVGMSFFLTGDV